MLKICCYKSFSLIFGGDGAGGTESVLEFFVAAAAACFSSRSCDFSLVLLLLLVVDAVAPPLSGCVFCCGWVIGGGARFFDCQFTSSTDTNFLRRSKY